MFLLLVGEVITQAPAQVSQGTSVLDTITKVALIIGIPSIIAACIYVGRQLQLLSSLNKTMEKVKDNLTYVCNFMMINISGFDDSRLKSFSPINLTAEGEKFLQSIKFQDVFAEHKSDFFNYIDNQKPKTKFDVEMASFRSIINLWHRDYFQAVKIYLYNNPKENPNTLIQIMGVYVREEYLKEHTDIKE